MIDAPAEFVAFLKEEYDRCRDDMLEEERETAIKRYNGEPYGDEEEGSSQVVSRATAETVDYMVISIMRAIESGDRVVEFLHKNSDAAHEATETIMHILMDEQDGYQMLHDWLKAGLLEKTAVAMAYPEERPAKRKEMTLSVMELAMAAEQGVEFIEAEEAGPDEMGEPTFNVVTLEEQPPKFCTTAVPNEEFYCSPDARHITEAALKGRKVRKTLSELVQDGYDRDEVETIGGEVWNDSTVANARDQDRVWQQESRKGGNRVVWWHEEFARFDMNGDGIAELLYVKRSADFKIFAIEEMEDADDHPFEDWCPFPMQHRRIGQSLADKTMDLERIDTVIMRQTLNGIYIANKPTTYVHEDSMGENTMDDILTVPMAGGRVIRWRGAVEPKERMGGFDPTIGFGALEVIERRRETRTGITRLNMGLDEDTLNKTAKGQAGLMQKGEQIEEYIARNFANALARLITKLARLLQRYGQPIEVPIDGKYKQVDPTQWPPDMLARARLGLGASRKDQRLLFRDKILGMQTAAFEAGLGLVDEQKLFNSAKGIIADTRLGDVSEFFNEPPKDEQGNPIPPEPQPDPEQMKVEGELKMQAARLEGEQQLAAAKLQGDQQAMAAKLDAAREEATLKQQLAREQAEFEAKLAIEKMNREHALELQRMDREAELEERRMSMDARRQEHDAGLREKESDAKLSANRKGGSLAK